MLSKPFVTEIPFATFGEGAVVFCKLTGRHGTILARKISASVTPEEFAGCLLPAWKEVEASAYAWERIMPASLPGYFNMAGWERHVHLSPSGTVTIACHEEDDLEFLLKIARRD